MSTSGRIFQIICIPHEACYKLNELISCPGKAMASPAAFVSTRTSNMVMLLSEVGLSKTGGDPQKVFFLFFLTEQLWIVWLHDDEPSSFVSYTSMYPVSDTPNLPFLMFLTFLIVFAVPLHLLLPDSLCLIYFADLCSLWDPYLLASVASGHSRPWRRWSHPETHRLKWGWKMWGWMMGGCCGSDHGPMGLGWFSCDHHWVWWINKYEMSLNSSCFIVINLKGLLLRFDNK